jgi:zinc protease
VHPYHHDTIGSEADIAAMPTAHTYSSTFFDRHYRPQHAAVIVVGDVDPEQVFSWTEAAYGGWSQGKSTAPSVPKEPVQTEKREARLDWPTPTAPQLAMAWKAPGYDPDSATYVSLHLVSSLLMGEVGPLKRRLIREEGLAYSVQVELDAFVDPGLFKIVVELKDAAHVDAAEAIVRDEVSSLGQAIEAGWFDETRTRDRYQTLTSLDNPDSVSSQLGWAWRRTRSVDAIDRFFVTYSGLTPTGVSSVVQDMFTDRTLTRVVLMPPAEEGASQ